MVDFKLVIAGDGEENKNLVRLMNHYQLNDRIDFIGYTGNVNAYFKGSDIVVAPSIAEPFGLIVLEAYNYSKPVIAFDVTAFNENIINNETGYLVPPYDIKEFADKIKYLLENKTVSRKLGEGGHELLINKFSLDISIEKTINFYQTL